jgi:hypothetical protein
MWRLEVGSCQPLQRRLSRKIVNLPTNVEDVLHDTGINLFEITEDDDEFMM